MRLRAFCISIIAMLISGSALSGTIYYDAADWLAAINAFGPVTMGPYSGNVTFTDTIGTMQTDDRGQLIFNVTYDTSPPVAGHFHNFDWAFTLLGDLADNAFGSPNVTFSAPTSRLIQFNPEIVGFYSLTARTSELSSAGLINAENVRSDVSGFFGMVGSSFNFSSGCDFCDTFGNISLSDIQVAIPIAIIAEPSALVCLFSALLILMISARRLKRGGLGYNLLRRFVIPGYDPGNLGNIG